MACWKVVDNLSPHSVGTVLLEGDRHVGIGSEISEVDASVVQKYFVLEEIPDNSRYLHKEDQNK